MSTTRWARVLLIGLPLSASAQPVDLVSFYAMGRAADPAFQASRSEYEAVQQAVPEARGTLLPNISFTADFIDTDQEIKSSDNEVFGQGQSSFPTDVLSLSITQPIFRYENIARLRQARAEVREAGVRFFAAEQDLILRAATAYLGTLSAQDALEYAQAEAAATGRQLEQVTRRKEVGFANATEVYESRARHEFARSEVAQAESALDDSLEALREISGQSSIDVVPLSDNVPLTAPDPDDPEHWVAQSTTGNLALQARMEAIEIAAYEIKVARADAFPTLDLMLSSEQRQTEGSLFGGGSDVDTTDIMFRLHVPIFQGGQVKARRISAGHRLDQARQLAEQERRLVQRQTRSAYLGVVNGVIRVEALAQSVEAQKLTLASKQKGYEAGTSTNLEVLDAQRDLYLVLRDYSQARYDYLLSLLQLKSQAGSLSIEDLEALNRHLDGAQG